MSPHVSVTDIFNKNKPLVSSTEWNRKPALAVCKMSAFKFLMKTHVPTFIYVTLSICVHRALTNLVQKWKFQDIRMINMETTYVKYFYQWNSMKINKDEIKNKWDICTCIPASIQICFVFFCGENSIKHVIFYPSNLQVLRGL